MTWGVLSLIGYQNVKSYVRTTRYDYEGILDGPNVFDDPMGGGYAGGYEGGAAGGGSLATLVRSR